MSLFSNCRHLRSRLEMGVDLTRPITFSKFVKRRRHKNDHVNFTSFLKSKCAFFITLQTFALSTWNGRRSWWLNAGGPSTCSPHWSKCCTFCKAAAERQAKSPMSGNNRKIPLKNSFTLKVRKSQKSFFLSILPKNKQKNFPEFCPRWYLKSVLIKKINFILLYK